MSEKAKPSTSWSSPAGLDLNPRPPQTVRISRRTSMALVAIAVVLLGLFAYGGWKRRQRQFAALADANLPKTVAPATAAAADIEKDVPSGNSLTARPQALGPLGNNPGELRAPEDLKGPQQMCEGMIGGAYSPPMQPIYVTQQVQQANQPSPEEQRLQAAYQAEQSAMARRQASATDSATQPRLQQPCRLLMPSLLLYFRRSLKAVRQPRLP